MGEETTANAPETKTSSNNAMGLTEDNTGKLIVDWDASKFDPDIDVVAVHGIHGNSKDTWASTEDSSTTWLTEAIFDRLPWRYCWTRILKYSYSMEENDKGATYTRKGIRDHAFQLIKDLLELRKQGQIRRPIVFVAKDIGGIIVKNALHIASLDPAKFASITYTTVAMIFFQCPHRCSNPVDLGDGLTRLMLAGGHGHPRGIVGKVQRLVPSIIDVNGSFIGTNLLTKVTMVNVVSTVGDSSQRVFDKYTTTLDLPFEIVVETDRSHKDLTKAPPDQNYGSRIGDILGRAPYLFLVDETLNDILLNQAPPLRPIGPVDQAQEQVQWISQNETFRKWKSKNAASILHVHGSSGVSAASKYIFDQLRPGEENQSLLYYDFKLHDSRYNNVQAMLSTFVIQLIVHYHDDIKTPIAKNLEFLRHYHAWTNEDLYSFWMDLLHHKSSSTITYIINGFDQCTESRSWFLKKLLSTIDKWDRPFKVVITSTGHEREIQDALADIASSIDLNHPPQHHGIHAHGRRLMTNCQRAGLIYSNSFLCTRERNLDKIISACGSDEPLQWLVMEWLKASNGTNEDRSIDDRLDNLTSQSTIAPDEVLNMILSFVPPQRQCLVRQAIAWVSSSFRPLIKAEFNVILALGEMEERPQELHDALRKMKHAGEVISRFLAGVFILENNEVRFSHPSAPELFIGGKALPDNDWCIFEREGAAHEVIARSCLSYLSLPEVQIRMATFYEAKDQVERPPLVSEDYSLLQYAVTRWAQHYKHATVSERLSKQAIDFLKDSDSMTCWAKMYHALSNHVTRDDQPFSSALEIVSGFGLEDLMAYFSNEMKEAYSMALTAAIKNNHTEMALKIFGGLAPTDSLGHNAIMAAASGAYESSFLTLIEHIFSRTSEAFEWPSDLLARGAWLGWGDVVDKLIASGIEVDPPHPLHGMSPLHLAARNNQPGIVKALLQGKANSNVRDESGVTPLHTASFYGHDEVVELLIKEGADLEAKQDDDQTALEIACTSGHGKVVESLAKASPRTRLQDPEFSGPLLSNAIQRGFINICHVLLEAAPHLVDHCDAGCPLFIRAAETDNVALVELLAQRGAEIDVRWTSDRAEGTALYYAARRGSKAVTECLLRLKADPNLSFYGNQTPIYIASFNGHAEVVQLLVDQEVDVNAVDTGAWGPLQVAYDSAPVTRILLQAKAEVDHISQSGTALYLASRWNYIEVVKALLEYHARVDIPCPEEGRYRLATPLIVAVDMGNVEIAKLLLEAGADVNYRKAWKNFALQYAMQSEECMKALLEYNPSLDLVDEDGDTALHCVEVETPVPTIKRLLNAGANPEIVNDMGYTPVCMAILNQNLPVVQYLISKNVRLDFTGEQRGGPLHLACHLASSECIKDLVNGGANVNLCEPEVTGTPLQAFCFGQADWSEEEEGAKQMIEFLIQVGANVNKKGGKLGYPLHAACLSSTPGIIKFLIEKGADVAVEDVMGRNPAQLASFRTTEHVELFDAEEYRRLFSERDALGRTALHYAVVSGRLDLVKRVYDLSGREVDIADHDGWTPLMWAARTCRQWGTSTFEQTEIIQFLKDEGANLWVRGEGLLNGGWSPLKVARYYEAPTEITRMLVPKCKETWDSSFHLTNRGKDPGEHLYCDACLMGLWGIFFHCLQCRDYDLCFKCYRGREIFHPIHSFREDGEETEREFDESEEEDGEEGDSDEDEEEDVAVEAEGEVAEVAGDEEPVSDGESGASDGIEKTGEQERDGAMNTGYDRERVERESEGGAEAENEQENNGAVDDDDDDDNSQGAEIDCLRRDTF